MSVRTSLPETKDPAILPLTRITELMEHAAARLLRPCLEVGESSAAVALELTYVARPPNYGNLRAVATHAGNSGRVHRCIVNVFDESGLVASAKLSRAVVVESRREELPRRRSATDRPAA